MRKFFLISAIVLLTGCQSARQNYQLVKTSDLLLVIDEQFHFALTDHGKFRKVTLASWDCYVPDEKTEAVFFCADNGRVVFFTSQKSRPKSLSDAPGMTEDHTHD